MASFCKYCGKALQDGEICTCPQAQAEAAQQYQNQSQQPPPGGYPPPPPPGYQPPPPPPPGGYQTPPPPGGYQPQQSAGPNPFVLGLKRIPPFLQAYLKAPVTTVRSLVSAKDIIVSCVLLVVQAIISGLLVFSFLYSSVAAAFSSIGLSGSYMRGMTPPFFQSFFIGFLIALVSVAVYVVVVFGVSKILGSKASFVEALVAAGGHSVFVTALLLLSFITFFITIWVGAIFFAIAMLVWVMLTVPTVQSITPNPKEGTLWILSIVGVFIVQGVNGFIAGFIINAMAS